MVSGIQLTVSLLSPTACIREMRRYQPYQIRFSRLNIEGTRSAVGNVSISCLSAFPHCGAEEEIRGKDVAAAVAASAAGDEGGISPRSPQPPDASVEGVSRSSQLIPASSSNLSTFPLPSVSFSSSLLTSREAAARLCLCPPRGGLLPAAGPGARRPIKALKSALSRNYFSPLRRIGQLHGRHFPWRRRRRQSPCHSSHVTRPSLDSDRRGLLEGIAAPRCFAHSLEAPSPATLTDSSESLTGASSVKQPFLPSFLPSDLVRPLRF